MQQNQYVSKMIRLCYDAHPYYGHLFRKLGLTPDDFETVSDLKKIPPLSKAEYVSDPEAFKLKLDNMPGLTLEETTLADIIYTSGSTSRPVPFYDTIHDRFARVQLMARGASIAGVDSKDIVLNIFPLSSVTHQGFLSASWGPMAAGAKLLTGLTGRPYSEFPIHRRMDEAIDIVEKQRVTILWGITSYVRKFIMRAQELRKDFSSVRMAMVMGEPCPIFMREDIKSRLIKMGSKSPITNNGYGLTETQGPAMECVELGGMHQPSPEQFFFEVMDADTGDSLGDGQQGLLLLSHLNRRGTVLLRYIGGDLVVLNHETCQNCGRTEPRFIGSPRRVDGFIKLKGTLINVGSIQDELAILLSKGVVEYQIVLTKQDQSDPLSQDTFTLKIACSEFDKKSIGIEVERILKHSIQIMPAIEYLPPNGFAEVSGEYKFKRVIDERGN